MSKKINQKEINQTVWKACDTFRGIIDPSIQRLYIDYAIFKIH